MTRLFALSLLLLSALVLAACGSATQTPAARPAVSATATAPRPPAAGPTAGAPATVATSGSGGVAAVSSSGREVVYAIQPGTARRQAAGEIVAMFPPEIQMTVGARDILVIRNDDDVPVSIDGLVLDPGQKATQKYYTSGTFSLVCSTDYHNERVKIVVDGPAK